jgi:RHS repeat-associated protein
MIHNDHLATPQKMTDSNGTVVWAADYKPFGEATIAVSTITNNLRFPGQYYDTETGLNYNYFRDYNPVIGRYIEADPIGLKGGMNHLFTYVDQNPITFIDPEGLTPGGGSGATIQPQGYCDGNWKQVGFDRVYNFRCKCYWICNSCDSQSLWSGNNQSLPFTYGNMINSPEGKGAGVKRGDACLCDKPGPDTGCNKCKK